MEHLRHIIILDRLPDGTWAACLPADIGSMHQSRGDLCSMTATDRVLKRIAQDISDAERDEEAPDA